MEEEIKQENLFTVLFKKYQSLNLEEKTKIHRISMSYLNMEQLIGKRRLLEELILKEGDDFSKTMNDKLEEIKDIALKKFEELIEKFKSSYEIYKKRISNYIFEKETNLSKIFSENKNNEILLKYVVNNIFNNINDITEVYDNITDNIEDNFNFLSDYLEKNELINKKDIKEYFLSKYYKDIIKCSILSNFNFKETDISKLQKIGYYKYYLNYLKEYKNEGVIKTFTLKQGEMKKGIPFIKENFNSLQTLNIHGMEAHEFKTLLNNIIDNNSNRNNNGLKKIIMKDFNLSEKIEKAKLNQLELSKLKKIKILSGRCLHPRYLSEFFLKKTHCLTSLSLEKIQMTDYGLNKLFHFFQLNPYFFDTLEYLSLAGNCITAVNKDIFKSEEMCNKSFTKLITFNLYKNNIYKYEISLEKMPALKLLDLSSNSILNGSIMENMITVKNKLVLFNDNIFITNNYNNSNIYTNYLNKQLQKLDFGLKVLHLGFTYNKEKQDLMKELKLSHSIKLTLVKLDLSFCGLKTDVLISFLKNNFGLFSLKKLNLKYNNIESDVFTKLNCDEILLENINIIDLSENNIRCTNFVDNENLVKLIKKYNNLEMIKLLNSYYFESWTKNISAKNDPESKFKNLFKDLKRFLREKDRRFMFVINEENCSTFNSNDFQDLFSFRYII